MRDRNDPEVKKHLDFVNAASAACKEKRSSKFICPLCGGVANAARLGSSGHVWATCDGCGMQVTQ